MKFTIFVTAFAIISGVAAKDCCCNVLPANECDCKGPYADNVNCDEICRIRNSFSC
ncbi:hypothetical protein CMEL01_03665 [Colletotrichum melonis]|uniref:Uncharacterized protein n=2 Tax=Colletotrichum acutatum species complex TaxID=2707335 RepID=A0A9P7R0B4_9PEZI|nr:hypothetical protein JMJ77_0003853 [Colletotrichum scovillei]KAG7049101.1 hypothetical protein JMJ78_0013084 [Colletotrichum scovillei]KAG7063843.1 hypothetical protein JMJ76_0006891 [Colletotrichum scovillei]KAK1454905.1 hypothetical protein CMEL01_03665 [Colletotrichum melonis]